MKPTIPAPWTKVIERFGRILLGAVFVYASLGKIAQPAAFAQAVANYQMLPLPAVNAAALVLPWLELVCGLGLISGRLVRGSALVISLLLVVFMAALGYSAYRGLDIACGCFSLNNEGAGRIYSDLIRDGVLLLASLTLLMWPRPVRQANRDRQL